MTQFICELATPEALLLSVPAEMVEAPGAMGDFGALAGHAPFLTALRPGVVTVHESQNLLKRIFVSGGVVDVTPTHCTILAESAEFVESIVLADAQARLDHARKERAEASDPAAIAREDARIAIAEARMHAVQGK